MKLRLIILFALSFLFITNASAYKIEAKRGVVNDGYNFWLSTPDSVSAENPKPVIIFLHGASLCGYDMNRVRRYGTIDAIERGRKIDAYVIAPQNPGGAWQPKKVMNILDWVMENADVDSSRVYVVGMSLGGYGTLDVAAAYPDRIAAAMAFCGGATAKNLEGLNELPLWIIHGTADRAISISESDKVVSAMKSSNAETPRLIYDRVPGMNHSQPARFFYMAETYEWLFAHSLDDDNRPCIESFDLTGNSHTAYAGLRHNGKKSIKASKSSKRKTAKRSKRRSKKSTRSAKARR